MKGKTFPSQQNLQKKNQENLATNGFETNKNVFNNLAKLINILKSDMKYYMKLKFLIRQLDKN